MARNVRGSLAGVLLTFALGWTTGWSQLTLPQWSDKPAPDLGGTLFRDLFGEENEPHEHTEAPQEVPPLLESMEFAVMEDLSASLVEQYFPDTLEQRVLDPQNLLTQSRLDGILNFLDYHFREASSQIHILVFKPNQRVPSALDLHEIHQRWFGDELGVLVLYNFGNPAMSRLIFGSTAEASVSEARRRSACVESINEALIVSHAEDQLERFLTELSRRLYWIEEAFHGSGGEETEEELPEEASSVAADTEASLPPRRLWFTVLSIVSILILAGGAIMSLQRCAARKTYYFPERRHFPRLGGRYGGGNRVVIRFGEAKPERRIS